LIDENFRDGSIQLRIITGLSDEIRPPDFVNTPLKKEQ